MKNGNYLEKNNKNRQEHLTAEERAEIRIRRSRKQKQRQRLLMGIGTLIVLLIIAVIVILLPDSPLEGKWDMDGVTAYEFLKSGRGAMVLPSVEYEFTYTVKDNTLYIDFDYNGAKDAQYVFTVEGNTLKLDGGNATTQGTYVLTKSK